MTVEEVAKELGVSQERIRKLCQVGQMGEKVAGVWLITRDQVDEFKRTRRPRGRPSKQS